MSSVNADLANAVQAYFLLSENLGMVLDRLVTSIRNENAASQEARDWHAKFKSYRERMPDVLEHVQCLLDQEMPA